MVISFSTEILQKTSFDNYNIYYLLSVTNGVCMWVCVRVVLSMSLSVLVSACL